MKGTLARVFFFVVDMFMLTMHIDIKGKKKDHEMNCDLFKKAQFI